MSRLLVHITSGPEHPTRAALGFLVGRTALSSGHEVDMFLAGDAVALLRDSTMDLVQGIGTGSLREHFEALAAGGATFYASGMSSKAREVTVEALVARASSSPRRSGSSSSSSQLTAFLATRRPASPEWPRPAR